MGNTESQQYVTGKMMAAELQAKRRLYEFHLTKGEMEVFELILDGFSNTEIADKLCKSVRTIEGRRLSLMKKTETCNLAGLLQFARQYGLI